MRHYWVDRVDLIEPGVRAEGVKCVALSEDVFLDHFPGNPVLPGVYVIEGLAQTAGALLYWSTDRKSVGVMSSIDRVRFLSFARPGDVVRLSVELENMDDAAARLRCAAAIGERRIAEARITFRLLPVDEMISPTFIPLWTEGMEMLVGQFPGRRDATEA